MQAELTGICHWCGKEIDTAAGVRLVVAIPIYGAPHWFMVDEQWVHSITEDCDGVVRKPCPDHYGYWYATEGGEGCPRCTEI